jgi:hydrogenase nickel incorporation protein HypA/HybF
MHEESLIRTLLKQVTNLAVAHCAVEVEEVELEIGPLSNVETLLLESAFVRLAIDSIFRNARLRIQKVELSVACDKCHSESELQDFRFVCSLCGSQSVRILRGDSVRLLNVKLMMEDVPVISTPSK